MIYSTYNCTLYLTMYMHVCNSSLVPKASLILIITSCCSHSQEFLHYTIYGTSLADSEETMSLQPSVPPAAVPMPKRTLYPVPSPIASPRPGHMWPGSPSNYAVPSIPPLSVPSPKHGASGIRTGRGGWECELTLEQFKQLLTPPTTPPTNLDGYPDDCSPLEVFLGSLSLLYQFANHVSKFQAGQQTPIPVSEILNIHSFLYVCIDSSPYPRIFSIMNENS